MRLPCGRGTMTMKRFWDDFRVKRKRQNMWNGKTNHVKRESSTACVVFKDNVFLRFSLAWFLKTIETIETIFFYVKWKRPTACVVFKDNIFLRFSLALFLKTIETIETIFFYVKWKRPTACVVFKDNRDNRDNLFYFWTLAFVIWNLKQASPKAANIHNRWWRERSERNLRFHSKIT